MSTVPGNGSGKSWTKVHKIWPMVKCGKIQAGDFSLLEESYLYAPACRIVNTESVTSCWAPAITRILAAGYSFLGNRYTENGFLFRGMESGITESITDGCFGHFDGSREEGRVERIMDIFFLTNEIRDALTIAGLETNKDGGILVMPTAHFNRSLAERTAAIMAIGDSGMVFRYPFLTEKISLDDVFLLIVTRPLAEKLMTLHPEINRKLLIFTPYTDINNEETLRQTFLEREVQPATVLQDSVKPRREDLVTI